MSLIHGRATRVYFGALDLSSYLKSATMGATLDTAETSTFGVSAKTYIGGQRDRTLSFDGLYDPLLLSPETTLGVDSGVLTYCPVGAASIGDHAWMASVIGTQYDASAPIGDAVSFTWGVQTSGPVALGYVLHPLGTDTNTTTGANRDDSAATATGWLMHLHVTAVSSGTWTIKLVDASASNFSDVADVTGGSFTAATGATQQRLTSATATTALRRYTRYVATVAGGSTPTITFALALSRTYNP